jgi:hypothetical protein
MDNLEACKKAIGISEEFKPAIFRLFDDLAAVVANPLLEGYEVWDFRHDSKFTNLL